MLDFLEWRKSFELGSSENYIGPDHLCHMCPSLSPTLDIGEDSKNILKTWL